MAGPSELMAGAPPWPEDRRVTLANWQDPPWNRWSFQHVRELIPTARIRRAEVPSPLPRAEQDLDDLRLTSDGREWTLARTLAETFTDGFLVLHHGRIVTERYFNGMRPDVTHLLMSVSKSVVGTVAGILAGRGELDVAADVGDIVPELAATSFSGATVQDLLDMRAGTRFDEDYDNLDADVRVYERVYLWRPDDGTPRPADALGYYATLVNDGRHGGPFRYRSILTDVLGWVLERAVDRRLPELITELLWRPLGAAADAEITLDAHGNAMADGGICTTLPDLARFGASYLGAGGLIPHSWIDDVVQGAPDGADAFVAGDNPPGWPPGAHYRNCWWVRDPGAPLFMASGIYGQNVFVLPAADLVVAKFSTWPTPLSQPFRALTTDAVLAIADALSAQV